MHSRVWKFRPPRDGEAAFVAAYSAHGRWAELFSLGNGYRGTSLLRPGQQEGGETGWWLTIDRWDSLANFEGFLRDFGGRYRALDAELEGVAGEEEFVGAFEEDE